MTAMLSNPAAAAVRNASQASPLSTRFASHVAAPGEGPAYWSMGDLLTFKLGPEHTAGALSMAEAWIAPGGGAPPHVHHREDEMFYVLEGRMEFTLGDELIEGLPGDAFFLPRGIPHTFKNAGTAPARALVFATPCGFERFIPEFGTPAGDAVEPPPDTPELVDRLMAACTRYGLDMKFEHRPRDTTPSPAKQR